MYQINKITTCSRSASKEYLRFFSGVLSLLFFATQSLWAGIPVIPSDIGRITDSYTPAEGNAAEPRVIHIRTVHMNYDVQKKVEKLLEHITKTGDIHLIGLEGADVPIDPDQTFRIKDPAIRYQAAEELAKEGVITGAELFSIHAPKDIRIVGVEDRPLYQANVQLLRRVMAHQSEGLDFINRMADRARKLESKALPRETHQIILARRQYEDTQDGLLLYFHLLDESAARAGLDVRPDKYPAVAALFLLEQLERFIRAHEHEITAEWDGLKTLHPLAPEAEMGAYIRTHTIDRLRYPRLGAYKTFLDLAEENQRNAHQSFDEAKKLEMRLLDLLLLKRIERDLVAFEDHLGKLRQLILLKSVREDAAQLDSERQILTCKALTERMSKLEASILGNSPETPVASPKTFDALLADALAFYRVAEKRDHAMLDRFMNELGPHGRGIIITGGFHSEGITDALRMQNISHEVILPNVENISDHDAYLHSFMPREWANKEVDVDQAHLRGSLTLGARSGLDPFMGIVRGMRLLASEINIAGKAQTPERLQLPSLSLPEHLWPAFGFEDIRLLGGARVDNSRILTMQGIRRDDGRVTDLTLSISDDNRIGLRLDGKDQLAPVDGVDPIERLVRDGRLSRQATQAINLLLFLLGLDQTIESLRSQQGEMRQILDAEIPTWAEPVSNVSALSPTLRSPRTDTFAAVNPRLRTALESAPVDLRDAIRAAYVETLGISSLFSAGIQDGPHDLRALLHLQSQTGPVLDSALKQSRANLGMPPLSIGRIEWMTASGFGSISRRPNIRMFDAGSIPLPYRILPDDTATVAVTPEHALRIREDLIRGQSLSELLQGRRRAFELGLSPDNAAADRLEGLTSQIMRQHIVQGLRERSVDPRVIDAFDRLTSGEEQQTILVVSTKLSYEILAQLALDVQAQKTGYFVYVNAELVPGSPEFDVVDALRSQTDNFRVLNVPGQQPGTAEAAQYVASFLRGHLNESRFLDPIRKDLGGANLLAHTSIGGEEAFIERLNETDLVLAGSELRRFLRPAGLNKNDRTALQYFERSVLQAARIDEFVAHGLIERDTRFGQDNVYRPTNLVIQSLSAIFESLRDAAQAFGASA